MTQGVLSAQEEQESEVKNLLKGYLNQQREMAHTLRGNLAKFKDALAKGEVQRVKECHEMIKEVITNQDARKEDVTSKPKEFQKEQQEMVKKLKELLAKGRDLRIRDFKSMLEEFNISHKERITRREERREEVQGMLGNFKKKRVEVDRSGRVIKQTDKGEIQVRAENVPPSVG
jgi:arginyl-tRNA synthetase